MAIEQPLATDPLSAPDHSLLHRIIAADLAAAVQSLTVDGNGAVKVAKFLTEAQNSGVTLTTANFGKTITVDSGSNQIVELPSVAAGNIGGWFRIVKLGTATVTIAAADSDTIADSGAGGTFYNDLSGEDYATITLQLSAETEWIITGGHGTWITTD